MARLFILIAALGAFGAHALKNRLDDHALGVYQTAVQYHFYHSLALLGVGLACLALPGTRLLAYSGYGFMAGILVFSGSLFMLAMTGVRWLGAVTPFGGLAFMLGWLLLAVAALQPTD